MAHPLEKEIVEGCIAKSAQYQQILYKTYYGKMLSVCMRYAKDRDEAKDILQEGFIKVFTHIDKFKLEGSLEGWVRRIMVNTAINHFHQNKKLLNQTDYEDGDLPENEHTVTDEEATSKLGYDELMELVQQLSPAYQMVFNLYVVEGFSHKEIAEMLHISEGTSKSNLAKARMKLQKQVIELVGMQNNVSLCLKN